MDIDEFTFADVRKLDEPWIETSNGDAKILRDILGKVDAVDERTAKLERERAYDVEFAELLHSTIWNYVEQNYVRYHPAYFDELCRVSLGPNFYDEEVLSRRVMGHVLVLSPSTVISQLKKFIAEKATYHELILYANWCLSDTLEKCPLYRCYVSRILSRMYMCSEDRLSSWLTDLTNTECILAGLLIHRRTHNSSSRYDERNDGNVFDTLFNECFDFFGYKDPVLHEISAMVRRHVRDFSTPGEAAVAVPVTAETVVLDQNTFNVVPIKMQTFTEKSVLLNRMFWLWNGASFHSSHGNFVYDPKGFVNKLRSWGLYDVMKKAKNSVKLEDAMDLPSVRAACDTSNISAGNSGSRLLKSGQSYGDLATIKPYSRSYIAYTEVGVRSSSDCGSFVIGNLYLNNFEIRTPATVSTLTFDYQRIGIPRDDRFCTYVTPKRHITDYVVRAIKHLNEFRDYVCEIDARALLCLAPIVKDKLQQPDEIAHEEYVGGIYLDYAEVVRMTTRFVRNFDFYLTQFEKDVGYRTMVCVLARVVGFVDRELVKMYIDNGKFVEMLCRAFEVADVSTDVASTSSDQLNARRELNAIKRYNSARCSEYAFERKNMVDNVRKRKWTEDEVDARALPNGFDDCVRLLMQDRKYASTLVNVKPTVFTKARKNARVDIMSFRTRTAKEITQFDVDTRSERTKYLLEVKLMESIRDVDWANGTSNDMAFERCDLDLLCRAYALYVIASRANVIPNYKFSPPHGVDDPRYIISRKIDSYATAYETWLTARMSMTPSCEHLPQCVNLTIRRAICNTVTSLYLFCDNSITSVAYFANVLHSIKFPGQNDRTVYLLKGSSSSGKSCLIERIRDYYNSEFGVVNEQALRNQSNETNTALVPLASNFCCQLDEIQDIAAKRMKSIISESKQYYRVFHEQEPRVMSMMASLFITVNDMFTIDSDDGVVTRLRFIMPLYHHYHDCAQRLQDTCKYNSNLAAPNVAYQFLSRTYPKGLNWDVFMRGCFYLFEYFCRYSVQHINDSFFAKVDRLSANEGFVRLTYSLTDSFGGSSPISLEPQPTMFHSAREETLLQIDSFKRFLNQYTVVRGDLAWNDERLFVWFEDNYFRFSVSSARPSKQDINIIVDRFKTEFRCYRDDATSNYVVEIIENSEKRSEN